MPPRGSPADYTFFILFLIHPPSLKATTKKAIKSLFGERNTQNRVVGSSMHFYLILWHGQCLSLSSSWWIRTLLSIDSHFWMRKNLRWCLPECLAIHGIVKLVTLFFHFRSIADRESQSQSFNLIFSPSIHFANFSHIADFPVNLYFNWDFTLFFVSQIFSRFSNFLFLLQKSFHNNPRFFTQFKIIKSLCVISE